MQQTTKMRLVCPNCDAQYEVPSDVMPPEGRDVQCSACGHGWFQLHPDFPNGEVPDTEGAPEPEAREVAQTAPRPTQKPSSENAGPMDATETPAPPRRELDPAVASVLRAEAELEARARRKEAAAVETQPDLGLPEGAERKKASARTAPGNVAAFPARPKPERRQEADSPEKAPPAQNAPRRDLLPDIEELKSTLRSNQDRSPPIDHGQTAQVESQDAHSARLGFTLTLTLTGVLAIVYVFAAQLAEGIPELAPALERYVVLVDTARLWLAEALAAFASWAMVQASALLDWVQGLSGGTL